MRIPVFGCIVKIYCFGAVLTMKITGQENFFTQHSLCQPGNGKGCSACCGLFNLEDISRESCNELLRGCTGSFNPRTLKGYAGDEVIPGEKDFPPRDITSHICPFQGFITTGTPGCLAHPFVNNGSDYRKFSLFGSKICGDFLCPAHSILDDMAASILIEFTDDWYTYSVGVIDPYSLLWIIDCCRSLKGDQVFKVTAEKEKGSLLLSGSLEIHAGYLNAKNTTVFHYGLSEYTAASEYFSLGSPRTDMDEERDVIRSFIRKV